MPDYNEFKKEVLELIDKEKLYVKVTAKGAGLIGFYKPEVEFSIRIDNNGKYKVWNEYLGDYMKADESKVFWREFWLKWRKNMNELFKQIKGCKNE
jgi:hypothetical protein